MASDAHMPEVGGVLTQEATIAGGGDRSRRDLLRALGAAAAGVVAGGVLGTGKAQAHGTAHYDSNTVDPAVHGNNTSSFDGSVGVHGTAVSGIGIGVLGEGDPGVLGRGKTFSDGVSGLAEFGAGVRGFSQGGPGVFGRSTDDVGVEGSSERFIGVHASSDQGTALFVAGKAKFATSRSGTIPSGQDSVIVSNPAVTALSHITATLTGSPGVFLSGFPPVIQWLERQPAQGFVIHLTRKVGQATPFTYLIVEPT